MDVIFITHVPKKTTNPTFQANSVQTWKIRAPTFPAPHVVRRRRPGVHSTWPCFSGRRSSVVGHACRAASAGPCCGSSNSSTVVSDVVATEEDVARPTWTAVAEQLKVKSCS